MKLLAKRTNYVLNKYISDNRNKIDESLVSLRLMKEIDDFLEINDISQREFADSIDVTESYVSQLMTGVKKINTSFINRLEKAYSLKIEFNIKSELDEFISYSSGNSLEIGSSIIDLVEINNVYTYKNNSGDFFILSK